MGDYDITNILSPIVQILVHFFFLPLILLQSLSCGTSSVIYGGILKILSNIVVICHFQENGWMEQGCDLVMKIIKIKIN